MALKFYSVAIGSKHKVRKFFFFLRGGGGGGVNSYICKNYREKTGRGDLFAPPNPE